MDPRVAIPRSIVNFAIRKLAGLLLYLIQRQAQYVHEQNHDCPHARRIRENTDFYKEWLLPKLTAVCAKNGWDVPQVSYFNS